MLIHQRDTRIVKMSKFLHLARTRPNVTLGVNENGIADAGSEWVMSPALRTPHGLNESVPVIDAPTVIFPLVSRNGILAWYECRKHLGVNHRGVVVLVTRDTGRDDAEGCHLCQLESQLGIAAIGDAADRRASIGVGDVSKFPFSVLHELFEMGMQCRFAAANGYALVVFSSKSDCLVEVLPRHIMPTGRAREAAMSALHIAPIRNLNVETHIVVSVPDSDTNVNRFLQLFFSHRRRNSPPEMVLFEVSLALRLT